MTQLAHDLANALKAAERPGDFYASGTLDMHPLRLEAEGVGPIALPLLPGQAERLIAQAEQAPCGRGSETLVDPEVRRTWQLDAASVQICGRRWAEDLGQIVQQAADGLGVSGAVEAELYKLLVYDTGSFFVPHRDTEKAPGMFATMVVVLPSPFTGGELVIRHKGHEARLDLRRDEPSEVAWAAFYADCRHEVLPIASGYRLALIYNLIRPHGEPIPQPPDHDSVCAVVTDLLRAWGQGPNQQQPDQDEPNKLVLPLEHAYSEAELGFQTLKGADAAVAGVVRAAAEAAGCDLHLGLVSVYEYGLAEHTGYYGGWGRRRGWRDDDADEEFEIIEATEEGRVIRHWRLPDGSAPAIGELDIDDNELSPPDAFAGFDDIEPDFQEATGNEGASYERSYQCAALVVWPRSHRGAVLAAGGLGVSMPYLSALLDRWRQAAASDRDALREEAHALALAIRDHWPNKVSRPWWASGHAQEGDLIAALAEIGDHAAAAEFILDQIAAGTYDAADNAQLVKVLAELSKAQAAELLGAVISGNALVKPAACADLLARYTAHPGHAGDALRPAAEALLAALPGSAATPAELPPEQRYRHEPPSAALVADTLTALSRIDPDPAETAPAEPARTERAQAEQVRVEEQRAEEERAQREHAGQGLAEQALSLFLKDHERYPIDSVLLPAALHLVEQDRPGASEALPNADSDAPGTAANRLRNAVLQHLEQRIAEPLAPPADWERPATVQCTCTDCRNLNRFLASPTESTWRLKAAEQSRRHVEHSIQRSQCDLDCTTNKLGRPYTLVCKKNQASYERRVQQREKDLDDRARLTGR
ncbi:2OG-Fe(II) oxygenase [Halochromatium glycolicum]|uniref:Prolyl 4-hydroxylase alpha subunit Fe(2+) 2OG dioxygenase domain-containing protein n=1 Tax=Halochromatium glycolicum TaxID=85075 RepID=A0AAJ0U4D1_9GAMM|nr:2OG-Fe(II) oxygenase [Halochromatium glycolicum]MBK1704620.1 hypothetical protein [Halochromatium glycolicum]